MCAGAATRSESPNDASEDLRLLRTVVQRSIRLDLLGPRRFPFVVVAAPFARALRTVQSVCERRIEPLGIHCGRWWRSG